MWPKLQIRSLNMCKDRIAESLMFITSPSNLIFIPAKIPVKRSMKIKSKKLFWVKETNLIKL